MTRALILFSAILFVISGKSEPAEARSLICTLGESMKAVNGDVKSTITFTNRTKKKQVVYWVDYDGKRHNYQELEPGETYDQPTFMTHPWVVTDKNGKCIGVYLAERQKITVEAGYKGKKKSNKPKTKVVKSKPTAKVEKRVAVSKEQVRSKKKIAAEPLPELLPSKPNADQPGDQFASLGDEFDDSEYEETRDRSRETKRKSNEDDVDLGEEVFEGVSRRTEPDLYDDDRRSSDRIYDNETDDGIYRDDLFRPKRETRRRLRSSWRCGPDSPPTEQTICEYDRLKRLDGELNELYYALLHEVRPRARRKLNFAQRRWLRRRNRCGRRVDCIAQRTQQRLARLNAQLERAIGRRNAREERLDRCADGFLTLDGDCIRDEADLWRSPKPTRLVCGPGKRDNGYGRCVRYRRGVTIFRN